MKKYLRIFLPLLAVSAVVILFILWMRTPAEGTITSKTEGSKNASTLQDKQLNGMYIAFQYNGKYIAGQNSPANNDLERYTLSAGTNYDKRIQAAVVNLPDSNLASNGDYIYREKTPAVYTKRQLQTSAGLFDIWVKRDGSEQTAFAAHGQKVAVFSFTTSPGADSTLTTEVDTLLKSLKWKQ